MPKSGLTYVISIIKFYVVFFFADFIDNVSQQYCENFRTFEEKELV